MSLTITGKVRNPLSSLSISSAIVRLHRKDTGVLLSSTTSDTLGDFSFSTTDFAPYNLFLISYKTGLYAGVLDIRKSYIHIPYHIYNAITDINTDLIIVDPPTTGTIRLVKVIIESTTLSTSAGTLGVYNTSSGGGSGIVVSITSGAYKWSNTGEITTSNYFYIRSISPAQGVSNATITLVYEYPELISVPLGGN